MIKSRKYFGVLFALMFFFFFGFGIYTVADSVFAGDFVTSYSNVLEDLGKDESFDVADYPVDVTDYSLSIVTIGESEDNELFIYVYQPCFPKNFRATSISMSTSENNVTPRLYSLNFVNKSGTLYKYKVSDFTVSSDSVRYYEIYSIFRRYDSEIDPSPEDPSQTINEVSFKVAKKWSVYSSGDYYVMECREVEVITVTDKFVGFVRYPDGFVWLGVSGACDSHFVAFNTDRQMDRLLEADLSYTSQSYRRDWSQASGAAETYGSVGESSVSLNYTQRESYQGSGLFAYRYVWNRIESVSDFISNTEDSQIYSGVVFNASSGTRLTDEAKASLRGMSWILRFAETPYHYESAGSGMSAIAQTTSTLVGSVTILRLYFETDGVFYNLGVVDNKQTGSDQPVNDPDDTHMDVELSDAIPQFFERVGDFFKDFGASASDVLKILFAVLGVVLVIALFVWIYKMVRTSSKSSGHKKTYKKRRR